MADIRSLDMGPLTSVTLSNGQKIDLPRLTTSKLIRIAKFIAIDGMRIYGNFRELLEDPNLSEVEKVTTVVSELTDEQIIHILAILLDISDEEALNIDPFDNLEIITKYVEHTDVDKAFTNVQKLIEKFKKQNQNQNQQVDESQQTKSAMVGSSS